MNKQQLQQDINDIKNKLASMEAQLEELNSEPFPQKGDRYYYIHPWKEIKTVRADDSEGRLNVYKSKNEAETALKIELAKHRVKQAIKIANNGWQPNWDQDTKYFIGLRNLSVHNKDCSTLTCNSTVTYKSLPNWMYCISEEIANHIIINYKDDLRLILSE